MVLLGLHGDRLEATQALSSKLLSSGVTQIAQKEIHLALAHFATSSDERIQDVTTSGEESLQGSL